MWRRLLVLGCGATLVLGGAMGAVGGAGIAAAATSTARGASAPSVAGASAMPSFGPNQWLTLINYYRAASGVPPVTDNVSWSAGIEQHLVYLAKTTPNLMTGQYANLHSENPASPYHTAAGTTEGEHSDLDPGTPGESAVQYVATWLQAPFHAVGMLRPQLRQVGFASTPSSGWAGLDVISGLATTAPKTAPVVYPGTGTTTDRTVFGGEYPNPLQTCGWTSLTAGLPLIAFLPSTPGAGVQASITGPTGNESSGAGTVCVVDTSTFHTTTSVYGPTGQTILSDTHLVFVIPRAPLTNGHYTASLTPPGGSAITWSFNVTAPTPPLPTPVVGMAATPDGGGYWLADAEGGVSAHGDAVNYGSMAGQPLNASITHIVATPDGKGYWLVAADGGTFAFGDAGFYGSMGGKPLNAPVVDIAPTPDGKGYWLVASDGGIFAFGDAGFHGSMGGKPLDAPVVGIAPDLATGGYWEVATDGGIFAFGAPFYGSMGGQPLNTPINGMSALPTGTGYRFVASDGGIFSFGAPFYGSMGGQPLNAPVVGMAGDPATGGYWLVASDGGIFAFGAPFHGSD